MVADYLQQALVEDLKQLFDGALFRAPGEPEEPGKPKLAPLKVFPRACLYQSRQRCRRRT